MFREHMHHSADPSCHRGFRERGPWGGERGQAFARFGGRHGHFERFFAAGGGGRERLFDGGDLQLVILSLLAEKPSYGYELIKAIEERMGGGYAPSPGVVYPTLTLLEERGFAQIEPSEGSRKVYGITEAGRAELAAQAERLAELRARLDQGKERFGRGSSPRIRRAFMELRQAMLRKTMREGGSGLSAEQVNKIAEAIEQATRAIDGL